MNRITLKNNFHSTEYTLVVPFGLPLSEYQIRRCRKRLCGVEDCLCGGVLGERGPQNVVVEENSGTIRLLRVERAAPTKPESTLNAVIVIDCRGKETYNFDSVKAFPDTPEGNEQAESLFREWVKSILAEASEESIRVALEDGLYEVGDGYIAILHTT